MQWCLWQAGSVRKAGAWILAAALLLAGACAPGTLEPVRLHPPGDRADRSLPPDIQANRQDLDIFLRDTAATAQGEQTVPVQRLPTDRIKVGILLPLTGPDNRVGTALLHAAEQALFDVGDPWIELVPRDTLGTPDGARVAMEEVLAAGAEVVLGPLLATSVRAAAPVARLSNVNVISFSTDRSVAGDNVFLLGFSPESEVKRVIEYARAQGLRKFAALVPETPYGDRVADAIRTATSGRPGDLVRITTYPPRTDSIYDPVRALADYDERHRALLEMRRMVGALESEEAKTLLEELEERDTIGPVSFDAVLIAEGGSMLEALAPLLPFYDIDPKLVRFLGTGLWDDPGTLIEPSLEGGWFTGPHPMKGREFFERFETTFGYEPPRISSLGYDAMTLVAALQYSTRPDVFSADALREPRGFTGTDGAFRFKADGTAERNLAIMEVGSRGFRVIDEAPDLFEVASMASGRAPSARLEPVVISEPTPESRPEATAPAPQRRDALGRWR